MKFLLKPLFVSTCLAASTSVLALETERQLSLDSGNLDSFFIDSGAGSLTVSGKADLKQIQVDAQISVDGVDEDEAADWLNKHMILTLTEKNGKAVLKATFEEKKFFNWGSNGERKIDLKVYMPDHLALEVDDGSGWSKVDNIKANVEFDDGSGDLDITNITGNLKVDDGSGSLTITNVDGDLYVDDGSGKMYIDQVTGEVEIEDGSGNIKITNVAKRVYIDDGSGSVDACHLASDLTVDDGSGSVNTCDDIKGKVVIK